MASVTSRQRDRNRFKKVYPFVRRQPVIELVQDTEMTQEVGEVTLAAASEGTYTFSETFTSAPIITATSVETTVAGSAAVNVYVSSVTTTSVTFKTSAPMTGKIHFHAIYVA